MIDQAIERFDLMAYVRDRGAVEAQDGEWIMYCPTCGKEKLTVNTKKKTWHCWVCQKFATTVTGIGMRRKAVSGAGGLLDLLQLLEPCDRKRAVQLVLASATLTAQDLATIGVTEFTSFVTSYHQDVVKIAPPPNWRRIDAPLPYMAYRGITLEDANRLGLFWCDGGRYGNRLVFPVWEEGQLVYWQARAMWTPPPGDKHFLKALNPPAQPGVAVSSDVLLNLNAARFYPRVAVVEGPVDCAHAGPSAVASFGKALSAVQIAKLWRAGVRALTLCWDGPSAREPQGAWPEMMQMAPVLGMLFDLRLVFLPFGDPGQRTREEMAWYLDRAIPWKPRSELQL